MKDNKHQNAIPEAVLNEVHNHIIAIKTALASYMITRSAEDRRSMLKMGDKSFAFVEKAHDYARDNPNFIPNYMDMGEFDQDFKDARGLWSLLSQVKQLEEGLEDTIMTAGSEAFHSALAFYHNCKAAAKEDVPGAKVIAEDLQSRFPGGRRKPSETETETITETIKKEIKVD